MTDKIHEQIEGSDGNPLFNQDGTPATFFDLLASTASKAREIGCELVIETNPETGEREYGLTGPAVDQIKAYHAEYPMASLKEAMAALGIGWPRR